MNNQCLLVGLLPFLAAFGETTVDANHPYAYGANIGWLDARGDVTHGASVGYAYCTGYVWSANCGWIGLGNGPSNGWHYGNVTANDWGVNHDGEGRLTGYAYGANIGWLAFEQTYGQPRIDLRTGNLSGHVWGANVGWISLSNVQAYVRSETLDDGPDSDGDRIPDAWEYQRAGSLKALSGARHDADGDGVPDVDEYLADTDPTDKEDRLEIVAFSAAVGTNTLSWTSRPSRLYRVEATNALPAVAGGGWADVCGGLLGPPAVSPAAAAVSDDGNPARYYRVRAVIPLAQ